MNARWRMLKHGYSDHPLYMPVNFIFLMSYIVFRIIAMGMLLLRNYQVLQLVDTWADPPIVSTCTVISTVLQVLLYLIQLFWFWLIIGAVAKTLQGKKPVIASKDD